MKFLIGLVIGAIIAAAIGAGALAVAFGDIDDVNFEDRDRSADVTETFDLAGFDKIDVTGVYELEVTVGEDFSIEIAGPEDEMARVDATVDGDTLVLDTRDRRRGEKRRWNNDGVTAKISMPSLVSLDITGVVDGEVGGIDAEAFEVDLSGVGDLDLSGTCGDLNADVSGVGDLDAEDLECRTVDVDVSGVGSATVYASESVEASVTGMGNIDVYGSPATVDKNGGMFSSISVK